MNFNYSKWNILLGWITFSIAFIIYLLTIEPNLSYWDCGEYISSASKLEIGHAPGAAFFQLMGSIFAIFAFGNESYYPIIINMTSALYSAFTILFLFWTISYLILKIFKKLKLINNNILLHINVLFGAFIGSLSFAVTDTFWGSAVEGEVYAMALCCISLLLWLILKCENSSTKEEEYRWILLISFIIGISIGIHMMILLIVPTLCFLYYNKNIVFTWKNFCIINIIIFIIFIIIFKGIFPLIIKIFSDIEIYFVNKLKLPFNIGTIFVFILLFIFFSFTIYITIKYQLFIINLICFSIFFMCIGFSCWCIIPIRANANPPININNPNTAFHTLEYYNREQYGNLPILYGPTYTAFLAKNGILKDENGNFINIIYGAFYEKNNKFQQYLKLSDKFYYKYNHKHEGWFPRMYSSDINIIENYGLLTKYPEFYIDEEYLNNDQANEIINRLNYQKKNKDINIIDYYKYYDILNIKKPTFLENFIFFINYQCKFMFLRYFFWNFIGKQNDIHGQYNINKGNWLSGITWFDEHILKLGNQKLLSKQFKNESTNYYYFLPFILGCIGLFFHIYVDIRRCYALIILFLLTSLGIIIYTNMQPFEPRERDYIFVGSFYTFSIWIGIGTSFLMSLINNKKFYFKFLLIFIFIILTPILLITQNWNDHNRSNRTLVYDQAYSYLHNLGNNAILFTYSDNDTYPIWGGQETALLRRDVRIINYTLLGTSWYIDQLKRKVYTSLPIPGQMQHQNYQIGVNDIICIMDKKEIDDWLEYLQFNNLNNINFELLEQIPKKDYMTPKEAINYILNNNDIIKRKFIQTRYQSYKRDINFLPVKTIIIPVNKNNVIKYKIVEKENQHLISDFIFLKITGSYFKKELLVFLDLLANYNWDRPIYFSLIGSYANENLFFLKDYLQYEGFTYKLVPIKTRNFSNNILGHINIKTLYNNIKKFKWGHFENSQIYYDDNSKQNIIYYRKAVVRSVIELLKNNNKDKAIKLLNLLKKEIPIDLFCFKNSDVNSLLYLYLLVGDYTYSKLIINIYTKNILNEFDYYIKSNHISKNLFIQEILFLENEYINLLQSIINAYNISHQKQKLKICINKVLNPINKQFQQKINFLIVKNKNILKKSLYKEYYKSIYNILSKFNIIFITN